MTDAEKRERARKLRQFALAVSDPTSPTYSNAVDSYIFAFQLSDEDIKAETLQAVTRRAYRARHSPFVLKTIEGIQKNLRAATGLSSAEYIQLLLTRERYFAKRGIPGDAAASARLLQFIGKTCGHMADKPIVDPNAPKPALISGEELAQAFIEAAQRLQRIREPNPMPALPASAEIIVENTEESKSAD